MIKISDAITDVIESNPVFSSALHEGIANLSELARKIHPLIEARLHKGIQLSALIMNLSRMAKDFRKQEQKKLKFKKIHINSDLTVFTLENFREADEKVHQVYRLVKEKNGYITISQGVHETTIILDSTFFDAAKKCIHHTMKAIIHDISAVGITFDEEYIRTPGCVSKVARVLEIQGINIVELASTFTELTLYIHSKDRGLCFDTLQRKFF